jgi:hypothetical protein
VLFFAVEAGEPLPSPVDDFALAFVLEVLAVDFAPAVLVFFLRVLVCAREWPGSKRRRTQARATSR